MTEAKQMAKVLRMIAQRYPEGRMIAVDSRTLGRIARLLDPDGERAALADDGRSRAVAALMRTDGTETAL